MEKTLEETGTGNDFLTRTPITQEIRARNDKWDCIKLKSFCTSKETITRMKRQSTEWEKIFASYLSDKGLLSRIYKELKKIKLSKNRTIWWINRQMNWTAVAFFMNLFATCIYFENSLFNTHSHKENANQNDTEILSHPSQNDYHQENIQQSSTGDSIL
jgi:hypothetical protein